MKRYRPLSVCVVHLWLSIPFMLWVDPERRILRATIDMYTSRTAQYSLVWKKLQTVG